MQAFTALVPITTPLALIAFIVAAAFYAYRSYLLHQRRTIERLPSEAKLIAIEATLLNFRIDPEKLSNKQKFELAMAQIKFKAQRFLIASIVVCVLAFVVGCISITSLAFPG